MQRREPQKKEERRLARQFWNEKPATRFCVGFIVFVVAEIIVYVTEDRLLLERCDTIVWLDLPRWQVMWSITARTLRRAATREPLFHGNVETWRQVFSRDSMIVGPGAATRVAAASTPRSSPTPHPPTARASASPPAPR